LKIHGENLTEPDEAMPSPRGRPPFYRLPPNERACVAKTLQGGRGTLLGMAINPRGGLENLQVAYEKEGTAFSI
jgi:hypothetical protein